MCSGYFRFIRGFNDWELKLVEYFFDILYSNIPNRESPGP